METLFETQRKFYMFKKMVFTETKETNVEHLSPYSFCLLLIAFYDKSSNLSGLYKKQIFTLGIHSFSSFFYFHREALQPKN